MKEKDSPRRTVVTPHVQCHLVHHRTGAVRSQKAACSRPTVQEVGTTMRPVRHVFTLTSPVSSLSTIQPCQVSSKHVKKGIGCTTA